MFRNSKTRNAEEFLRFDETTSGVDSRQRIEAALKTLRGLRQLISNIQFL
jgi:hypothetical protein